MTYYKRFLLVPAIVSVLAVVALAVWRLQPGIDLTGGSLLQVSYASSTPATSAVSASVASQGIDGAIVQPSGSDAFIIRAPSLSNEQKNAIESSLSKLGSIHEDQFISVGPTIGHELLQKGLIALALVALSVVLFIAWALRKVSKPVASWKYGLVAIATLVHDILIPVGLFAFLGHVRGAQVDSLFIVALLTLLGVSINNTIVVFDRIRENLRGTQEHRASESFQETVGKSIKQTLARSLNTSLTVVIVLAALYALGPVATQDFALTLITGIVAGTYSSIFLAAPLLVWIEARQLA